MGTSASVAGATAAQGAEADTAVQPGDLPAFGDVVGHNAADFDAAGTAAGLLAGAVRVAPDAVYSDVSDFTSLVPIGGTGAVATAILNPGDMYLARSIHSGQMLAKLAVLPTASLAANNAPVVIVCYRMAADGSGRPGVRAWQQAIPIPLLSLGVFVVVTGLALADVLGECWMGALNPGGNAGAITLSAATVDMAHNYVNLNLGVGVYGPVGATVSNGAGAPADLSACTLRQSSASATSLGFNGDFKFPVIGART